MTDAPTLQQLSAITLPVLIFKGAGACHEAPVKDGAGLYASLLPNAVVHPIPGACHDPWVTHTEDFFSRATAFLEQWK